MTTPRSASADESHEDVRVVHRLGRAWSEVRGRTWVKIFHKFPTPDGCGDVAMLQVARCTKIINPNTEDSKYVINVKQIAKVRLE